MSRSRWRNVSTTSIASITSSSGAASASSRDGGASRVVIASMRPSSSSSVAVPLGRLALSMRIQARCAPRTSAARRLDRECPAVVDELREPLLALLDGIADLLRIAGAELAHLGDDLPRVLLIAHDGVDELLHRLGADRRAVSRLERRLLHLAADLREILEAAAHAFLHRVECLRALVQPVQARERRAERGQHRLVGAEEADGLLVDAVFRVRRLQQPRHDDLGRVVRDRQVIGQILADLVAVLGMLHVAQALVPRELEPRAFGRVLVRAGGYGLHRRRELGLALLELFLGALQHLEREDLRLLQRAAEILIRGQYELLAVDLVARIARDVE